MGRFPLKIFIDKLVLKYYNHLLSLPDNSLAKQALLMSKFLYNRQKPCYLSNLSSMLVMYGLKYPINVQCPFTNSTIQSNYSIMKNKYLLYWKSNLEKSKKLRFYESFNERYEEEMYLQTIHDFNQRKQFTKFRISNHQLAIEKSRYLPQKIQASQRLCIFCDKHEVETEEHLLYQCSLYNNLRHDFFQKLNIRNYPLIDKEMLKRTNDLFNSENEKVIYYLSKFIYKCFQLRQEEVFKNNNIKL